MRTYGLLALAVIVPLSGCDLFVLKPKPAAQAPAQGTPAVPTPGAVPGVVPPAVGPNVGPSLGPGVPPVAPAVQRDVAGVGSGIKGRSLDDPKLVGALVEPARAYFKAKERIVFEIQVPEALKLYKAEFDNVPPASHEEFMEKIIQANSIPLPALPPGHRYVYDPQTEQLMVEKPAR